MSFLDDVKNRYSAPPAPRTPARFNAPAGSSAYAAQALQGEAAAVAEAQPGSRNHQLNKSAYNLGQLVAGGELDDHTVRLALLDAATAAGLDEREAARTIASGLAGGTTQPRQAPPEPDVAGWLATITQSPDDTGAPPADAGEAVRRALPILDWNALWSDDTQEQWIIEPLLPARRLIALYSPPKTGKSLLMLELAAAISEGGKVLGTAPPRPYRVLYVDFENDPKEDVRARLQAMGYTPDRLGNLCYLSFPTLGALDSEAGSLELIAAATEYQCEVVIIDTISRAIKGEENENDTWLSFYRHTGLKLKQHGIALVRLDHAGKDTSKGQRGGSAKNGDVDAVWRMATIIPDETYSLTCEMNRMPVSEKFLTIERKPLPHLHHEVQGAARYAAINRAAAAVAAWLDETGAPDDITRRAVRDRIRTTGIQASNSAILEALRLRKLARMQTPPLPFGDD